MNLTGSNNHLYRTEDLLREGVLEIGDGYRAKNEELGRVGVPFARAGNIAGGFHFQDADLFPVENLARVGPKISQSGDVVFTSKGTVGRFALVKGDTCPFVYSPQLCYWRSKDLDRVNPRFLFYWMHGPEFMRQANSMKGQTDMADYVSLGDQRRMHISLPRVEEQRAIAHILGTLDDKFELNRRTNRTLEEVARALFTSWFVAFDPVRTKAAGRQPAGMDAATAALFPSGFEDSVYGLIPKGWRRAGLDQIARYLNGLALQKYPPDGADSLPVIKIAQLRRGDTEGAERASATLHQDYVVNDGDVLFSWSGTLDVVLWCGGAGALNQHLFKVTSTDTPKWFYYLWTRHYLEHFQAIAKEKATTMGHIQRRHLAEATALVPDRPLLDAMSQIIAPVVDQVIVNRLQARTLATVRDMLLPRLLSGELRVPEAENLVIQGAT